VSVDLAILVSCDVTVGAWDWESSSVSMGSGPAPSGSELDILKAESVSYASGENGFLIELRFVSVIDITRLSR